MFNPTVFYDASLIKFRAPALIPTFTSLSCLLASVLKPSCYFLQPLPFRAIACIEAQLFSL